MIDWKCLHSSSHVWNLNLTPKRAQDSTPAVTLTLFEPTITCCPDVCRLFAEFLPSNHYSLILTMNNPSLCPHSRTSFPLITLWIQPLVEYCDSCNRMKFRRKDSIQWIPTPATRDSVRKTTEHLIWCPEDTAAVCLKKKKESSTKGSSQSSVELLSSVIKFLGELSPFEIF